MGTRARFHSTLLLTGRQKPASVLGPGPGRQKLASVLDLLVQNNRLTRPPETGLNMLRTTGTAGHEKRASDLGLCGKV